MTSSRIRAVFLGLIMLVSMCAGVSCARGSAQSPSTVSTRVVRIAFPQFVGRGPTLGLQRVPYLFRERLVSIRRDGRPSAALAKDWSVSPDGLNWRFKLHTNATFHDGSPMTAALVKDVLESAFLKQGTSSRGASYLTNVSAIDVIGTSEIVIRLRERSAFFLDDLALVADITKPSANGGVDGVGPFYPVESSAEQVVLKAHDRYHRGRPYVDRIIVRLYPTLRTAWASLMRDEADFLYEVGHDALEFVRNESSVQIFSFLRPYVFLIALNSARPELRDPRVRLALNLATDRQVVVEHALKGRGLPARGPVWPQHWAYDRESVGYDYDARKAVTLLDAAGNQAPKRGRAAKGTELSRFRFTCLVPENFTVFERIALLVQKNLYQIGVDMDIEALPLDLMLKRIQAGEFDAVMMEIAGGPSMTVPYLSWHSPQGVTGLNRFGYVNKKVDEALDGMRYAPTDEAFRTSAIRFQRAMYDDPPAIFLAWPETSRAVSKRFHVPAEPNHDILSTLWRWQPVKQAVSQ